MQPRLERLYQQYKTGDKNVYKRLGGSGQALMRISIKGLDIDMLLLAEFDSRQATLLLLFE